MDQIEKGIKNAVFYTDEANYLMSVTPPRLDEAENILRLAEKRGCADSYTDVMLGKLEKLRKK